MHVVGGRARVMAPENLEPSLLDILDYHASLNSIQEPEVQALLTLPTFKAAVSAFAYGLLPIGYAAFFSWPAAKSAMIDLTPDRLIDLVRHVARRTTLALSDRRLVTIDYAEGRATFPALFRREDHSTNLAKYHDELVSEMGHFAGSHPWRSRYNSFVRDYEERVYVAYWLQSCPQKIAPLFYDRRILAGLDAFHQGLLSYGGFVENVFEDGSHILFPDLGWRLSVLALIQLSKGIDAGELEIPAGLRAEFPRFYEFYYPEAFGHRT